MSCFSSNCEGNVSPDPHRRVSYSNGLVLGVDEFVQEEIYFLEQNRAHNRGIHGYGTVCGLFVEIQDTSADGPQIWVGPGTAVDPKGRVVRVCEAQCARINQWLRESGHTAGSPPVFGSPEDSPSGQVHLYLKLCYRECKTENVPIPGGPCRSVEETSVPSRIADSFRLELATKAPDQTEADVVREFGSLLRSIEFSTSQPATLSMDEWAALIRSLGSTGSPSSPALPIPAGSPPGFYIHPADADEFIRLAFRIWITELRPSLLPDRENCGCGTVRESCVLLAEISFAVREEAGQPIVDGVAAAVQLSQERRPYLIHTQLLQELWSGGATFQQIIGESGGSGQEQSSPEIPTDHGSLTGLNDDDHPQYLLVQDRDGSPGPLFDTLLRDISGNNTHHVTGLPFARPGFLDAMPVGQSAGDAAFGSVGDLTGTYPNPSIARLQGQLVSAAAPSPNQFLQFNGAAWVPSTIDINTDLPPILETDLLRVQAISWRHNSLVPARSVIEIPFTPIGGAAQRVLALAVVFGRSAAGDSEVLVRDGSLDPDTFQVFLEMQFNNSAFLVQRIRLLPEAGRIVPVKFPNPLDPSAGADEVSGPAAPGALFIIPRGTEELLDSAGRVIIELRGDHILDTDDRAIDAEFLRSQLPSGDRPAKVPMGIQGGTFYSWLELPTRIEGFGVRRFREAKLEDLVGLIPAVNEALARRILEFRDANPDIDSFERLRSTNGGVPGVGVAIVEALSRAFRF